MRKHFNDIDNKIDANKIEIKRLCYLKTKQTRLQ